MLKKGVIYFIEDSEMYALSSYVSAGRMYNRALSRTHPAWLPACLTLTTLRSFFFANEGLPIATLRLFCTSSVYLLIRGVKVKHNDPAECNIK